MSLIRVTTAMVTPSVVVARPPSPSLLILVTPAPRLVMIPSPGVPHLLPIAAPQNLVIITLVVAPNSLTGTVRLTVLLVARRIAIVIVCLQLIAKVGAAALLKAAIA